MLLSPSDAKRVADRLLSRSKADHCVITMGGDDAANLRFARGSATTNGYRSSLRVKVESRFGKRSGAVSVTGLDDNALDEAVARSEVMAQSAPENPELLPPPGPQSYPSGAGYDADTVAVRADRLAAETKPVIDEAARRNVDVTGYGAAGHRFEAMATSAGLFAHDRQTGAEFTVSARNREGTWSGWAGVSETRFGRLDIARLGRRAIDKATYAAPPIRLEPGKYTVILEPSPVCDLVGHMLWFMNARPADEGRSFFSAKAGGNKIGEKLFPDDVTIFSDPGDRVAPERVFGDEGLPQRRTAWVENGVLRNLVYSRFWAQQKGREPISRSRSFVMAGGPTSIDDMVRATKRGVLVTRLWYIRVLDPQKLVLTGLTRDGNFLIEDGRIVGPTLNFRFNESPIAMLANVLAVGPSERTIGGETEVSAVSAPTLLVKDFTFSSPSDAI
jgi:predicted Zn-dependent protease